MATASQEIAPTVLVLSRSDLEQRAEDLRLKQGCESIPVDPLLLAKRLGLAVYNATFTEEGIAGLLDKQGEQITLLVNQAAGPYRKRFTIAHELAHHVLHLPADGTLVDHEADLFRPFCDQQGSLSAEQRREAQANQFAVALLMPEQAVRSAWERHRSVAALARRFNVSAEAMGRRIDQLGLK